MIGFRRQGENLVGLLGTEGEGKGIRTTRKALFKFLKDTGLVNRI